MGAWYIKLDDDREFLFYHDSNCITSPLERIEEFNQGENWSLDLSSKFEGEFPLDPEDDSFVLIPKKRVVSVFYKED